MTFSDESAEALLRQQIAFLQKRLVKSLSQIDPKENDDGKKWKKFIARMISKKNEIGVYSDGDAASITNAVGHWQKTLAESRQEKRTTTLILLNGIAV